MYGDELCDLYKASAPSPSLKPYTHSPVYFSLLSADIKIPFPCLNPSLKLPSYLYPFGYI